MESTSTKVEVIKPEAILRAGIPLAVTVAGFIIARITQRKVSLLQASCIERTKDSPEIETSETHIDEEGSIHALDAETLCFEEEDDNHALADSHPKNEDIQCRGQELETRLNCYNYLKEQDMLLMEQENKSVMEMTKIELLEREISMLQGENEKFESIVAEYLKIMTLLEFSRSENGLLHRRVKNLQKKIKRLLCVVNEKNLQLKAKDAETSRNQADLENKDHIIKKIEKDNRDLKRVLEELQHERIGLHKPEMAEKADSPKNDADMVSMNAHKELLHELEQLQESKAAEEKELMYLRRFNAYLRHELMSRNQEDENQSELNNGEITDFASEHELRSSSAEDCGTCLRFQIGGHSHDHSKRKTWVQKIKKWSEKTS